MPTTARFTIRASRGRPLKPSGEGRTVAAFVARVMAASRDYRRWAPSFESALATAFTDEANRLGVLEPLASGAIER